MRTGALLRHSESPTDLLRVHFGEMSVVETPQGLTCALPGIYALKHVPVRLPSGHFLRAIHEFAVEAADYQTGASGLVEMLNRETVVLRHMPKANDRYLPTPDADYVVINKDDPLHEHGYAGYIDFNMVNFEDGEIQMGSTARKFLHPQWHVHLAPAADLIN